MKSYLRVAGLFCAFVLVQCKMDPELRIKLDACRKEFEIPEESLKSLDFEDPKVKCFSACLVEVDDRITDGKLSIEKEVDGGLIYLDKEQIDDSFKDKVTECVNKANEEKDDCAVAGAALKCYIDKFGPMQFQMEE